MCSTNTSPHSYRGSDHRSQVVVPVWELCARIGVRDRFRRNSHHSERVWEEGMRHAARRWLHGSRVRGSESRVFWDSMWTEGVPVFHLPAVNENLERFLDRLRPPASLARRPRVLVPLCGKTLDMAFLAHAGFDVVGACNGRGDGQRGESRVCTRLPSCRPSRTQAWSLRPRRCARRWMSSDSFPGPRSLAGSPCLRGRRRPFLRRLRRRLRPRPPHRGRSRC